MTDRDTQLAVVLRQAHWELDEMAYRLPRGSVTAEERNQLADELANLASLLRTYGNATIVDSHEKEDHS